MNLVKICRLDWQVSFAGLLLFCVLEDFLERWNKFIFSQQFEKLFLNKWASKRMSETFKYANAARKMSKERSDLIVWVEYLIVLLLEKILFLAL